MTAAAKDLGVNLSTLSHALNARGTADRVGLFKRVGVRYEYLPEFYVVNGVKYTSMLQAAKGVGMLPERFRRRYRERLLAGEEIEVAVEGGVAHGGASSSVDNDSRSGAGRRRSCVGGGAGAEQPQHAGALTVEGTQDHEQSAAWRKVPQVQGVGSGRGQLRKLCTSKSTDRQQVAGGCRR